MTETGHGDEEEEQRRSGPHHSSSDKRGISNHYTVTKKRWNRCEISGWQKETVTTHFLHAVIKILYLNFHSNCADLLGIKPSETTIRLVFHPLPSFQHSLYNKSTISSINMSVWASSGLIIVSRNLMCCNSGPVCSLKLIIMCSLLAACICVWLVVSIIAACFGSVCWKWEMWWICVSFLCCVCFLKAVYSTLSKLRCTEIWRLEGYIKSIKIEGTGRQQTDRSERERRMRGRSSPDQKEQRVGENPSQLSGAPSYCRCESSNQHVSTQHEVLNTSKSTLTS